MRRAKFFLAFIIWCSPILILAQSRSEWEGSFTGAILGLESILTGTLDGDQWTGVINVSGYPIVMTGTVIDMKCTGNIADEQTHTSTPFTATYSGKQIRIHIRDINPITGLEEDMEFVFVKTTTQEAVGTAIQKSITLDKVDNSPRDQNLTGLWRFTDTYVSGEYSFATDYFIQFNPNGVILVTDGRTAGGGPTSSLDSGEGDTHQGIWKTENKTLYTKEEGGQWGVYAKYYVDGNSMMLTYNNGRKQVWEKIND
jgi:hypothetical protein